MFNKLKDLASSVSGSVSESLSKVKETVSSTSAFENTSCALKSTKDSLISVSSSALEGSTEILNKSKNLALAQVVEADAKVVADMIDVATSMLPFMRVLDVTDKIGITNKNALIERAIKGIQEVAKKQLETTDLSNNSENLLAIEQGQSSQMKLYSQQLEQLIEFALLDNVLTEQEKQVLFKKAASEGIDLSEFEMVLQAKLFEKQKNIE